MYMSQILKFMSSLPFPPPPSYMPNNFVCCCICIYCNCFLYRFSYNKILNELLNQQLKVVQSSREFALSELGVDKGGHDGARGGGGAEPEMKVSCPGQPMREIILYINEIYSQVLLGKIYWKKLSLFLHFSNSNVLFSKRKQSFGRLSFQSPVLLQIGTCNLN